MGNRKWQRWEWKSSHCVISAFLDRGRSYLQWCSLFSLAQPRCRYSPRSWSPSGAHKCRPPGRCSQYTCQSKSLQLREEGKSMWTLHREKLFYSTTLIQGKTYVSILWVARDKRKTGCVNFFNITNSFKRLNSLPRWTFILFSWISKLAVISTITARVSQIPHCGLSLRKQWLSGPCSSHGG